MKEIKVKRGKPLLKQLFNIIGKDKAYIMGGFARWCCSTKKASLIKEAGDVDIYCKDQKVFDSMKSKLEDLGLQEYAKENPVCIMYKKHKKHFKGQMIQLIKPIEEFNLKTKGKMVDIIENFDFTIARIGIKDIDTAIADDDFIEHEKKNKIIVKFIHCPISSTIRLMKYAKKGYNISPREVFKLFKDWDERDDTYKVEIYKLFTKADEGKISDVEIEQLERLLRRD